MTSSNRADTQFVSSCQQRQQDDADVADHPEGVSRQHPGVSKPVYTSVVDSPESDRLPNHSQARPTRQTANAARECGEVRLAAPTEGRLEAPRARPEGRANGQFSALRPVPMGGTPFHAFPVTGQYHGRPA